MKCWTNDQCEQKVQMGHSWEQHIQLIQSWCTMRAITGETHVALNVSTQQIHRSAEQAGTSGLNSFAPIQQCTLKDFMLFMLQHFNAQPLTPHGMSIVMSWGSNKIKQGFSEPNQSLFPYNFTIFEEWI